MGQDGVRQNGKLDSVIELTVKKIGNLPVGGKGVEVRKIDRKWGTKTFRK